MKNEKKIINILKSVEKYYSDKIETHGPTHKGVDWNSSESQELRFEQLMKVIDNSSDFSIIDYGCGYGALLDFLQKKEGEFQYIGFDISEKMISMAKNLHSEHKNSYFLNNSSLLKSSDYTLSSGVFNVKLETSTIEWEEYVLFTINELARLSIKGFAFNMLTKYSDDEYIRPYLYYGDPLFFFDYCKKKFSKFVSLLHDYPLYEFTVIVKL